MHQNLLIDFHLNLLLLCASTVIGLVLGSFFNVVIGRYKSGQSIAYPASHCPKCNHVLRPWENIPVLSYIILKAKCSSCGLPISIRYPLVETLTGLAFGLIYYIYGYSLITPYYMVMFSLLINLFFIDYDHYELPTWLNFPAIAVAVLGEVYIVGNSIEYALTGALAGAGTFLLVYLIGRFLFKKEAMGVGDIILMGSLGAMTGAYMLPFLMVISGLYGIATHILFTILNRKNESECNVPVGAVPFGPSLILSAITCIVFKAQFTSLFFKTLLFCAA